MKKFTLALISLVFISCGNDDDSNDEISLFNESGEATAYYIEPEDEQIIYLWDGRPTSYIIADDEIIYGFNGKFLGWQEDGIIYNLDGKRVGFEEDALNISTLTEPAKLAKMAVPSKQAKEAEPAKPSLSMEWSTMPLDSFLLSGI